MLTARERSGGDTLIAFAVLHVLGFSMFWGPTPWVYLGESFPLRVRAKSIALGSATSMCSQSKATTLIYLSDWIWNFLLSFFAPRIANEYGHSAQVPVLRLAQHWTFDSFNFLRNASVWRRLRLPVYPRSQGSLS